MTQEQQIIEYLELNGPAFHHVIMKALGIDPAAVLTRAVKRGEVKVQMVLSPRRKCLVALYSAAEGRAHHFCRHTVKAVDGMAPPIPQGFNPANPFQLGRRNAT